MPRVFARRGTCWDAAIRVEASVNESRRIDIRRSNKMDLPRWPQNSTSVKIGGEERVAGKAAVAKAGIDVAGHGAGCMVHGAWWFPFLI